jgi:spore germination protein
MRNKILLTILVLFLMLCIFAPEALAYGNRVLRLGSKGEDVASFQRALSQLGYAVGRADGVFGSQTLKALISFQREHNLYPDGIAGTKTFTTLQQALQNQKQKYIVQPGDTLYRIARQHGVAVDDIIIFNKLNTTTICAGQVLLIPGRDNIPPPPEVPSQPQPPKSTPQPVHHTVQPGDTLFSLARKYDTTVAAIIGANNLKSTNIYVGQVLTLPTAESDPKFTPPPPPPPADEQQVDIAAYYVEYAVGDNVSWQSFRQYFPSMQTVIAAGYKVTATGQISGRTYENVHSLAQANNMRVLAMVSNIGSSGGFESELVHTVLSQPQVRTRTIENIYQLLKRAGYAGVNIDFENVPPKDRPLYTNFIRELADRLQPAGYQVTVAIPAKLNDNPNHGWSGAFDYQALGSIADQVMIMAYDQHYRTGSPGPVAGVDWVEKVIKYALSEIPAPKIRLGIPTYGYDWPATGGAGRSVTYPRAQELINQYQVTVNWDAGSQSPYFCYEEQQGHMREVWFENAASIAAKLDLVNKYNLGGIAIWRLGYEDPAIWELIVQKFSS